MDRLIAVLVALALVAPGMAATITVDDDGQADYQTIQSAINASWDGDTIIVSPGTYYERITFNGRRITVRSEDPNDTAIVEATVIQSTSGSCVTLDFGEGASSVLEGLTVIGAVHGVYCMGTSPTISKNVIRDCGGKGVCGSGDAAPAILGNTIASNTEEGVYACQGRIEGNAITGNSAGLGNCDGTIKGNVISGNADAGGLYFCNGTIQNNVITGNRATADGGGLYGCTGTIINNTIVGNRSTFNGGGLSACSGTITNNIIAYNEAVGGGGMDGVAQNTYNAFWTNSGGHFSGGASLGVGDTAVDPLFADKGSWDTNGTTETEDDDFWIDGDYHPQSEAGRWDADARQWVADSQTSRCIDIGKPATDWSAELWPHGGRVNMGAYGGTAAASMSSDADAGYLADLNLDSQINAIDLGLFTERWLVEENLLAEDLDRNGMVDLGDFILLGQGWRSSPPLPSPPLPNPMTWATAPYATGISTIAMVATKATSTDGTGVQYYFEDYDHANYNSGWLTFGANQEPSWQDTGLATETTYRYRVKARNRGNLLETDWSALASATTQREDYTAPLPNPMTWETEPYGLSGKISMVATEATDVSGVEYLFECTSDSQYSSGWQDSRTYEIESAPSGYYTFTVWARDKSANQNMTSRATPVTVDLQGPTPDPMEWEVEPYEVNIGGGSFEYYAKMTAVEATDDDSDVEYYFECTTRSGFSSGWQSSREYTVLVGRKAQAHRFRVKARDTSSSYNETGWSSELAAN